MRNFLTILSIFILFSGCKDNVDKQYSELNELISELESHFDNDYNDADIDNLGNFKFDMGSASSGRVSGKLTEVFISMEILPERPGCADICPEMAVIHFKCDAEKKCVTDPADPQLYGYHNEGVINFENLENGQKVYSLLNKIKNKLVSLHSTTP